jgi:hypothetical protein
VGDRLGEGFFSVGGATAGRAILAKVSDVLNRGHGWPGAGDENWCPVGHAVRNRGHV